MSRPSVPTAGKAKRRRGPGKPFAKGDDPRRGDLAKARERARSAPRVRPRKSSGAPETSHARNAIAEFWAGRWDEAAKIIDHALDLRRKCPWPARIKVIELVAAYHLGIPARRLEVSIHDDAEALAILDAMDARELNALAPPPRVIVSDQPARPVGGVGGNGHHGNGHPASLPTA